MDPPSLTLATGGVIVWLLLVWISRLRRKSLPYPPGPAGYPLIGYVHTPADPIWKTYREWSQKYNSDIVGYKILGTNIIIANTIEVANELLDRRSAIYSDRSTVGMTMAYELVGFRWTAALAPIGQYWREARKLLQQTFSPQLSRRYRPVQAAAIRRLLCNLLKDPLQFRDHTRYMTGEIIIRGSYGIDAQEKNDPYIAAAERVVCIANETLVPGKWLVDVLPILKYLPEWMPGAGFKRQARLWRSDSVAMTDNPFNAIKDRDDLPGYCAAKHMLENIDRNAEDAASFTMLDHIKNSLATVYSAGSDTTTSILDTFILAMALFPDIQREAQKDVDRVCEGRLPEYSDYGEIPYVDALVRECLRWRPPVPLSVPHMVTQDDIYNGYFIPAKSVIFPNIKAMLLDPNNYPEPEHFKPTRFLVKSGSTSGPDMVLDTSVSDPSNIVFGFGRRACPGRWFAYDSLWMAFASILATFDILPVNDENGRPVPPRDGCKGNFITHPEEFVCNIKPRSAQHKVIVTAAAASDI